MPVRIYSLAKELKLDSKVLVDICTSAGVLGKGSALASLTDEEVDRVKAFMNAPAPAMARPTQSAPLAPKRPPELTPSARVPLLEPKPRPVSAPPVAPVTAAPAAPVAPVAKAPPPQPVVQPPEPVVHRREDYLGPGGTTLDKVPVLGEKSSVRKRPGSDPSKPSARPPVQRSGPGIRLPAMPNAPQPVIKPAANEPAPQKPDLKLPPDAIRAGRAGSKPLSEHLRKHETKKRQEADQAALGDGGKAGLAGRGAKGGRKGVGDELPLAGAGKGRRGRGTSEADMDADRALLGGREQRQLARKKGTGDARRVGAGDDEDAPAPRRRPRVRMQRTGTNTAAPRKSNITLELPCTVRSFSEAVGIPAQQVLRKLLAMGTMSTITATIDAEMAELLAVELGVEIDFKHQVDFAQAQVAAVEGDDEESQREPRPPVITFLGHVDHGKTSLLDKIIGINVASGESGGITQHIRAYQIDKDGRKISFVDTPGHEAFTEMRARGANVTDIAVLVVAADDGVMPQTEEAISHIRAADVPIVVALNKIDLPGVDIDRIYQQLATNNLLPSEWGGDTEVVKTSATTGAGIDDLLDTLLTMAELHDFRANPNRAAYGTCLEAEVHEGRGVVAKLIVQNGTLKVGDAIVCGSSYGKVKALYDTLKPSVTYQQATPSMPVNVTGLNEAPGAGEHFHVLDNIATARQIAELRAGRSRRTMLGGVTAHVTLENLFEHLGQEEAQTLNIILRADTRGSIEAIQKELTKLDHPEVKVKILQASVGGVSEADVHLADASDAVVIAFNVVPDDRARGLAERQGVQIRRYEIIYKVTEDLKAALEGMLKPEQREMELGRALVQRTFTISRVGTIAGCRVLSGVVQRNARVRLIRENRVIGDYALDSLKREKDDAREVREGLECGIKVGGFNDLKEGDILEAYKVEEIARTF